MPLNLAIFLAAFLIFLYLLQTAWFYRGWRKLAVWVLREDDLPSISIIVPMRNESAQLKMTIRKLLAQDYPSAKMEIIVMDDFSEDDSADIVKSFDDKRLRYIHLSEFPTQCFPDRPNKKAAIQIAVKLASFENILISDADCLIEKGRLKAFAACLQDDSVHFVAGGVRVASTPNLLALFQELDGISMLGITAACIAQQFPVMANGANMAFRKADFLSLAAYEKDKHIATGDDVYLMHLIRNKFPEGVIFLNHPAGIVSTAAQENVIAFLHQRKRWLSKATLMPDRRITAVLVFNYIYALACIALMCLAWLDIHLLYLGLSLYTAKFLADTVFMCLPMRFQNALYLLPLLPLMEFLHLFYVLITGLLSFSSTYQWKGRSVLSKGK
jgi:cellulose synthase/poly-beta-1,6-N-acetylglucosamine synthase-like glycosyltransferase